ncbi:GNAT family N-acetyltransferase [Halovenus rubra]|uniref:GNAT family N-acetyltransferase n=2 Tax=Halovenus rubra TaxID=869890 RepID=A0ACC7DWG5_9EURY
MAGIEANREGVLVAVVDGAVRGFVDIRWGDAETKAFVNESEADLKAIYVEPEYWGEGIGTKLLERGLALLPDLTEAVRLDVFAKNERARQFYESHGFEQTDRSEHEIAEQSFPVAIYSLHS